MMRIRSHSESHIVELDNGSRWQIFPGDLDQTLNWKPETDLTVVPIEDDISSVSIVSAADGSRVRVIPEGEKWPAQKTKSILKEG
jgi:hypothetical protein